MVWITLRSHKAHMIHFLIEVTIAPMTFDSGAEEVGSFALLAALQGLILAVVTGRDMER